LKRDDQILSDIKNELKGCGDINLTSSTFDVGVKLWSKHCVLSFKHRTGDAKVDKTAEPFLNLVFLTDENLTNIMSAIMDVQRMWRRREVRKPDEQNIQCFWTLSIGTDTKRPKGGRISFDVKINWATRSSPDLRNERFPQLLLFFLKGDQGNITHEIRQYGPPLRKVNIPPNITARDFYDSVYVPPQDEVVSDKVQVAELTTPLLPFQRRTVNWLLEKEAVHFEHDMVVEGKSDELPEMFERYVSLEGKTFYANTALGWISTNLDALIYNQENLRGGILAEEMGLGNTPSRTVDMIHI